MIVKDLFTICTLGPSLKDPLTVSRLRDCGVKIFRINMSHAPIEEVCEWHKLLRDLNIDLAIDTEGAQVRTALFDNVPIKMLKGDDYCISLEGVTRADMQLSLTPIGVLDQLRAGDKLRLDFNGAVVNVKNISSDHLYVECISSGSVGANKGVDCLNRQLVMDDFTAKDNEAIDVAKDLGINKFFVSFCKSAESVRAIKQRVSDAWVCSKIESKLGIHELPSICREADGILIDRGDLSREISILDVPFAQRGIINMCNSFDKPCFVATNVLETLITGNLPTRAELSDIVNLFESGAAGVVLAAETAIGKKPVLCAEIVKELFHKYNLAKNGLMFCDVDRNEITDVEMSVWLNRLSA